LRWGFFGHRRGFRCRLGNGRGFFLDLVLRNGNDTFFGERCFELPRYRRFHGRGGPFDELADFLKLFKRAL
jgi:hypothetical protein